MERADATLGGALNRDRKDAIIPRTLRCDCQFACGAGTPQDETAQARSRVEFVNPRIVSLSRQLLHALLEEADQMTMEQKADARRSLLLWTEEQERKQLLLRMPIPGWIQ